MLGQTGPEVNASGNDITIDLGKTYEGKNIAFLTPPSLYVICPSMVSNSRVICFHIISAPGSLFCHPSNYTIHACMRSSHSVSYFPTFAVSRILLIQCYSSPSGLYKVQTVRRSEMRIFRPDLDKG